MGGGIATGRVRLATTAGEALQPGPSPKPQALSHFANHFPQGIDVGAPVDGGSFCELFGSGIAQRAGWLLELGMGVAVGKSEIYQFHIAAAQ